MQANDMSGSMHGHGHPLAEAHMDNVMYRMLLERIIIAFDNERSIITHDQMESIQHAKQLTGLGVKELTIDEPI